MSFGSIFRKVGRSVGNVFKKGVRAVGSVGKKIGSEITNVLPTAGSVGGSALGAEIGDSIALGLGQPELIPAFSVVGGGLGGLAGKELGKEAKRRITMPLPPGSVGGRPRLGVDPKTYTPRFSNPNENVDRGVPLVVVKRPPRNELERMKQMREPTEKIRFN